MRKGKYKGCCNNKVVITSLFSLIMLIALALNSYAMNCNLSKFANGLTLGPASILNVTWNETGITEASLTVNINLSSPSTANSSSLTRIYSVANTSGAAASAGNSTNITIGAHNNPVILEPSNDYTLRVSIANSTGEVECLSGSFTGIIIDRADVPVVPTALLPTSRQTSRTQTIQGVVVGENVTSCRLTFAGSNPGSTSYTMTHSGNNCSQVFSNLASTTFRYTISASDGTNRSAESSEATFYVDIAGTSGARKYIAATSGGGLPSQASSTAQQRAFGQQAENTLDKVIAKAPANAQQGLTNAKEAVTKQYKGREGFKTWTGTGVGCVAGFFVVPVIGVIPGCITGHLVGAVI